MKNSLSLAFALLIVGLANAFAIVWSVNRFVDTLTFKNLSPAVSIGNNRDVLPLSGDRFVIVENSKVSVFQVSKKGKLTRLDNVATIYNTLEPAYSVGNSDFDSPRVKAQKSSEMLQPTLTPTPWPTSAKQ